VSLNLRTPLYFAEAAYGRNEEKVKTSGSPSLTTVRDAIISTLYWRPDRFPDLKIQFSRDHLYDKERLNVDTVTDLYRVTSNYRPVEPLSLYYQGTFRNTELRLSDTTLEETVHNGRVNYSNNWWRRRITFGADYNITRDELETSTTGAGEVGLRVFPFAGLSASSDNPGNVVLALNPALIDDIPEVGAGVNLGSETGGDASLRNVGMEFFEKTEINTLYILVDRDVAQVADAFSWRIYTSDDDPRDGVQIWVPGQTVSPAIYSPTFNRFEIRFAKVTARYVKVVTAPLSPTVPFSSSYSTVFVTEIQAEIRRPASEVAEIVVDLQTETDFAILEQSTDLRVHFSRKGTWGPFYGFQRICFPAAQGFPEWKVAFRTEKTSATARLVFFGIGDGGSSRPCPNPSPSVERRIRRREKGHQHFIIYNIANLYEGIDANLSGGINIQKLDSGQENETTQFNAGASFVPNRKVNLTLLFDETRTVTSGGDLIGEITTYTRAGEADLSITPVQSVHLFGSYRIEESTESANRNILNYSLSWSPFPDGTLHLNFNYNETIRTDDTKERSIVPNLRWYVTPRSYLNLSYQRLKAETPALTTESDIYSGTVRVSF
jgi:hypothetical protein